MCGIFVASGAVLSMCVAMFVFMLLGYFLGNRNGYRFGWKEAVKNCRYEKMAVDAKLG